MTQIITINNKNLETLNLMFYEGSKEELILDEQNILIWCNQFEDFEYWLKIDIKDKELLKKYLSNDYFLLDLMKDNNLSLYKRYYKKYNEFIFDTNDVNKIIAKDIYLPNENTKLNYNFYEKGIKI